jgi:hypothetical protein
MREIFSLPANLAMEGSAWQTATLSCLKNPETPACSSLSRFTGTDQWQLLIRFENNQVANRVGLVVDPAPPAQLLDQRGAAFLMGFGQVQAKAFVTGPSSRNR